LSAQEDTVAHTGYSVSQGEMASSDGMQWHTGVPSGTVDNRQFITSYLMQRVLLVMALAVRGMRECFLQ
jgi:hypothetical protein